ncbi:unnamed protein product [Prorocentrum cordatum]|uniref:Uncharacterized protein n=1 Tax=Prorocentrum cordatum TaxID=2364126 RepID=A0ABN9WHR4_9DINO|nr:unnamed protein product [Polarella glacialis]
MQLRTPRKAGDTRGRSDQTASGIRYGQRRGRRRGGKAGHPTLQEGWEEVILASWPPDHGARRNEGRGRREEMGGAGGEKGRRREDGEGRDQGVMQREIDAEGPSLCQELPPKPCRGMKGGVHDAVAVWVPVVDVVELVAVSVVVVTDVAVPVVELVAAVLAETVATPTVPLAFALDALSVSAAAAVLSPKSTFVQADGHSFMPDLQPHETGHTPRMDVCVPGLQRSKPKRADSSYDARKRQPWRPRGCGTCGSASVHVLSSSETAMPPAQNRAVKFWMLSTGRRPTLFIPAAIFSRRSLAPHTPYM